MKRAVLKSFDPATYLAAVQLPGSLPTWLENVPVSRGLNSGQLVAGRNVAVLFFDESNPDDAVVAAVWT